MPSLENDPGWAFKVIFRRCRSDIFAMQKLYCCYAAVILYSPPKLPEGQYNLRSKYNWRSQYNSPKANIAEKMGRELFTCTEGICRTIL